MRRTAIITGVTGQDGSYLAELLDSMEYTVVGLIRRSSTNTTERLKGILGSPHFHLVECDLTDALCINSIVKRYAENADSVEIYNLAAQSHVQTSFDECFVRLWVARVYSAVRVQGQDSILPSWYL